MIDPADVRTDIDALISGFALHGIRRFMNQTHWLEESALAGKADEAEPGLKLENVAAHSWHVAECVLLLAGHFAELDPAHCLKLALLHDRLEAYTGDYDPIGPQGNGNGTHAFDVGAQNQKEQDEHAALERHLTTLRPALRDEQAALYREIIEGATPNVRFVMGLDKLQALAFVLNMKQGRFTDEHLAFTIRYSSKTIRYYPPLRAHFLELLDRVLDSVASVRRVPVSELQLRFLPQPAFEAAARTGT